MRELIRMWREAGFQLALYDTGTYDSRGCTRLDYKLWDNGKLIFAGGDYCPSPLHADDSDMSVAELLGFLTLKPGDTDSDYFGRYTPAQLDWCQSDRCEYLSLIQHDMEEQAAREWRTRQHA